MDNSIIDELTKASECCNEALLQCKKSIEVIDEAMSGMLLEKYSVAIEQLNSEIIKISEKTEYLKNIELQKSDIISL